MIQTQATRKNSYGASGPGSIADVANANPRLQLDYGVDAYQADSVATYGLSLSNGQEFFINLAYLGDPYFWGFSVIKEIVLYTESALAGYYFTVQGGDVDPWIFNGSAFDKIIYPRGRYVETAPYDGYPVTPASRFLKITGYVPESSSSSSSSSGGTSAPTTVSCYVVLKGIRSTSPNVSSSSSEFSSSGP